MKTLLCFSYLLICSITSNAGTKDYFQYHKNIIAAEKAIFLNGNSDLGLNLFKQTFSDYDFVFVDDCIEAFELALYYKNEDLATFFIKRAIDNGFEPQSLYLLNLGCPCNGYSEMGRKVTIWQPYMASHGKMLQLYSDSVYPQYLGRLDKQLIKAIWQRHAKEQLFKDAPVCLVWNEQGRDPMKTQHIAYDAVCDDNLRFMDSLAKKGRFLGEKNLGLYTLRLAEQLQLPPVDSFSRMYLRLYRLPLSTHVPVVDESSYFDLNPNFNILFHNVKSFDIMLPHSDSAIRRGFMHPREFATLLNNGRRSQETLVAMHLMPHTTLQLNRRAENELREKYCLSSLECDSAKHAFAHAHELKLHFGFRNGTR